MSHSKTSGKLSFVFLHVMKMIRPSILKNFVIDLKNKYK